MNQQSVQDSPQIVGEIQNFRRFVVSGGKTECGVVGVLLPSRHFGALATPADYAVFA